MQTLLINNHDSYADILAHVLWQVTGLKPWVIPNDALDWSHLRHQPFDHVVLSPGPGRPDTPGDFGVCRDILQACEKPVLGVCLGHQGLGVALGGNVVQAPAPRHGKASPVVHDGTGLFAGLPSPFWAMRYHALVVDEQSLGPDALVLARAEDDGTVMALGHRHRPLFGVQFHPEAFATTMGLALLRNFVEQSRNFRRAPPKRVPHNPRGLNRLHRHPLSWRAPEAAFAQLFAQAPHAFWLDHGGPTPGWSFMGTGTPCMQTQASDGGDALQAMRQCLQNNPMVAGDDDMPFVGGLVGYMGYGMQQAATLQRACVIKAPPLLPHCAMLEVRQFLAFHHPSQKAYACTVGARPDAQWLHTVQNAWQQVFPVPETTSTITTAVGLEIPWRGVQASLSPDAYVRAIGILQQAIVSGETYEACLSNMFYSDVAVDPHMVYQFLRALTQAPYGAFLRLPQGAVLSASPEQFLRLDRLGNIVTEPIKGTRRRGPTPSLDAQLKDDLAHSPKDKAELMMVTDLLRNDLARVAAMGSIEVRHARRISAYPTLFQASSQITARLDAPYDALDLLRAAFPGGSVTGAPKARTMALLDALEPHHRGVFTGCLGYVGYDGAMEMNILIRTLEWTPTAVRFGCGGAIVVDSDPHEELAEVLAKGEALARALAMARKASAAHHGKLTEDLRPKAQPLSMTEQAQKVL